MIVTKSVVFDVTEFSTLHRIAPCIRVAFRDEDFEGKYAGGRNLHGVCTRKRERHDARFIWAAFEQACKLEERLSIESKREYWERELIAAPDDSQYAKAMLVATGDNDTVVGLVAPGTDICGMLAENRLGMHRDVVEAVRLLDHARTIVGHPVDIDREAGF